MARSSFFLFGILIGSRVLLPDLKALRQKIKLSDIDKGDGMMCVFPLTEFVR